MIDGTYTAVVDRIVEETAVLLVEDDGEVIEQREVPVTELPEPAQEDGGVLTVTIADEAVNELTYESEETKNRRESISEKLDRLSTRLSDREG